MLRAQMYGCGAMIALRIGAEPNPVLSLTHRLPALAFASGEHIETMPDKRGRPLKGEPGYETSTRAKNIAKNNAKNKAKRLKKGEPGYETSAYFKKNAKNNAKKQERARKEATERISKFPGLVEAVLSPEAAFDVAKSILEKQATAVIPMPILKELYKEIGVDDVSLLPEDWLTLNQILWHTATSFYIGYTKQCLPDEALGWITPRGSEKRDKNGDFIATGERSRPTLLWPDGTCIKPSEATSLLGFKFFEVYASTLQINARAVEAALQKLKQALPLGTRLWRCADMGGKYDKKIDGHLHKVFFTVSPFIGDMVHTGEIIINE
jgi:hypothetical protein